MSQGERVVAIVARRYCEAASRPVTSSASVSPCRIALPSWTRRLRPAPTTTPSMRIAAPIGTPPSARPIRACSIATASSSSSVIEPYGNAAGRPAPGFETSPRTSADIAGVGHPLPFRAMSLRLRVMIPALLVVAVVVAGVSLYGGLGVRLDAAPGGSAAGAASSPAASRLAGGSPDPGPFGPSAGPEATPRPELGGTELYGYLPYWQMTGGIAGHLETTPLSTLALFSVTSRDDGTLDERAQGFRRITSGIGRRLIAEAHDRRTRVELVFTSFGSDRNARFFAAPAALTAPAASGSSIVAPGASAATPLAPWQRAVPALVELATDLGVDGINVDVEQLDAADRETYGRFLAELRAALVAAAPESRLSVATEAGRRGIDNAAAAARAGVDRLFLMGYEYHWSGSQPGASSPVDRTDGEAALRWSIDRYVEAGVPRDRILLGLPLYGMRWRTLGPDRSSPVVGKGVAWIPQKNAATLRDPSFRPGRDPIELSEFFAVPDGTTWLLTYYDSPATLRPKLALARDAGLAGAGFWAIGYERGLPGYSELMGDFRAGEIGRDEAPAALGGLPTAR